MKILYIAMKYDYGDPGRGLSFEHYNFYDSLVKMDGEKHKIIYFPFDEVMRSIGKGEMNIELLKTAEKERPDLCFFFLFTDEIGGETIRAVGKRSGAINFNWFADDHWRFDNFSKHYAPFFDWVATTDSQAPKKYRKIGYNNVIKTQWACNYFLYRPVAAEKKYDVTFVGQPHGNRGAIVKHIEDAGVGIECWGNGWLNSRISQEKMIEVFSTSKINLNLTKASGRLFNIKEIAKIFLNKRSDGSFRLHSPLRWYDNAKSLWNKRREQIKGRNFEIPGCGGFLLTADADNLRDYYEDGKEIVIFKDEKDLIEKIRYYLLHDSEREAIARRGYERTVREHTYEKRFNEIFKTMRLS